MNRLMGYWMGVPETGSLVIGWECVKQVRGLLDGSA
jgi:hypothetical protein